MRSLDPPCVKDLRMSESLSQTNELTLDVTCPATVSTGLDKVNSGATAKLPITVLIAAKNEELNISKCLTALSDFASVVVIDSSSTDRTTIVAAQLGAEVVNFNYDGGYPKNDNGHWTLWTSLRHGSCCSTRMKLLRLSLSAT